MSKVLLEGSSPQARRPPFARFDGIIQTAETTRPSFEVEILAVCTLTYTQLPPIQPAVWEAHTVAHPLIWERLKTWVGGWLVEKM